MVKHEQPNSTIPQALFELGQVVVTRGAADALSDINRHPVQLLALHVVGEWGCLPSEDIEANRRALERGSRLFSAYNFNEGARFYVITEWDRSATTVLLPEEY